VVDEAALAWALDERLIAGAALDVYEDEPLVHPGLLRLENVRPCTAPWQRHHRDENGRWPRSPSNNVLAVLDAANR